MQTQIKTVLLGTAMLITGPVFGIAGGDCEVHIDNIGVAHDDFYSTPPNDYHADGRFSDLAGTETIEFTHDWEGVSFETTTLNGPDQVFCSGSGGITADVFSVGTATVNGEPGYGYDLLTQDNRSTYGLCATIAYGPTSRNNAVTTFSPPRATTVPETLLVTAGGAGSGTARLTLNDFKCRYRGAGRDYVFDRCTGPGGSDIMPGDSLTVSEASLRILRADRGFATTTVNTPIGILLGRPDSYTLVIRDPAGDVFQTLVADVTCGDIVIDIKE